MKKNLSILILFLGIGFFLFGMHAYADSGWDYDYDSGGSYDVGDYDTGSDSGYRSSSGGGLGSSVPVSGGIIVICAAAFFVMMKKKKGKEPAFMPANNNSVEDEILERDMERGPVESIEILDNNYDSVIQKYLPDYTEEQLLKELYEIFVQVQEAWMNFDYNTLEKYCSNVLFESYRSDLKALEEKHGKNIMKDFELISSNIRNIEKRDNKVVVEMYLFVSFYDYVINEETNEVLRGNMDAPVRNPYDLEFIMYLEEMGNCPSCGAPLTGRECSSCHTIVDHKKNTFVLNKKGIMRG